MPNTSICRRPIGVAIRLTFVHPRPVLLLVASLLLGAAAPLRAIMAQAGSRDTTGRVTKLPDGGISVAGRLRGLVGASVSGRPARGPDGKMRFADFPVIVAIAPNSPAALSGLRVGDVVLQENDRDAREGKLFAADTSGVQFRVRVRRGEEVLDFTLVSVMRSAVQPGRPPE